ncbi:C25 family cysteine peptidase [Planctomycetota bacterium]
MTDRRIVLGVAVLVAALLLGVSDAGAEDLRRGGGDYLVITVDAAADALGPLVEHRRKHGLKPRVVRAQEVYEAYGKGEPSVDAIREFLREAAKRWKPAPRFVLLVGDAVTGGPAPDGQEMLPTGIVDTYDNGPSASDNVFVAEEDSALPTLAIGRFPSSDPAVVSRLVRRSIDYEKNTDHGPWRRRLSMIAGEGRFGEAADKAIESLATEILSTAVPYAYDINLTYASAGSPYLYVPSKLGEKVVERLNQGALLVNYTGHGHKDGFDRLKYKGKTYRIFTRDDLQNVNTSSRPPIVMITACWTGCFDDPRKDAIGEALFELEAGPVAVFASSRVSHPFANAVLSKEFVRSFFREREKGERPRLGELLREAKRATVENRDPQTMAIYQAGMLFLKDPKLLEKVIRDNMHLYNLFGDPALAVAYPQGADIKLDVPDAAIAGKSLRVKGKVKGLKSGTAIVSFELARNRFAEEEEGDDDESEEELSEDEQIERSYQLANKKALSRVEVKIERGRFQASLDVSDELFPGTYYVKAYVFGKDASGATSRALPLEYPEDED